MIYNSKIASSYICVLSKHHRNLSRLTIAGNAREKKRKSVRYKISKSINNNWKNEGSYFRRSLSLWIAVFRYRSNRLILTHIHIYVIKHTLDVHFDAQRCHWLNEQEASNEIFLREFSPTHAWQRIMTYGRMNRHGTRTLFLERCAWACTQALLWVESPLSIPDASIREEKEKERKTKKRRVAFRESIWLALRNSTAIELFIFRKYN